MPRNTILQISENADPELGEFAPIVIADRKKLTIPPEEITGVDLKDENLDNINKLLEMRVIAERQKAQEAATAAKAPEPTIAPSVEPTPTQATPTPPPPPPTPTPLEQSTIRPWRRSLLSC